MKCTIVTSDYHHRTTAVSEQSNLLLQVACRQHILLPVFTPLPPTLWSHNAAVSDYCYTESNICNNFKQSSPTHSLPLLRTCSLIARSVLSGLQQLELGVIKVTKPGRDRCVFIEQ